MCLNTTRVCVCVYVCVCVCVCVLIIGMVSSSGQLGSLIQPDAQIYINTTQLQSPDDSIVTNFLLSQGIIIIDGAANLTGQTICFNASLLIRAALTSVKPVAPLCGECGE